MASQIILGEEYSLELKLVFYSIPLFTTDNPLQDLRSGRLAPHPAFRGSLHHPLRMWERQVSCTSEVRKTCPQESQDSATRDSGIDTSSCFTSSEDSNRDCVPRKVGRDDWTNIRRRWLDQ